MIERILVGLCTLGLMSCGVETVSTLSAPPVSYSDQNSPLFMTFDQTGLYDNTVFQGYEVYYKVYPYVSGTEFQVRLAADVETLDSGPLSTLLANGYKALTQSTSVDSKAETEQLVIAKSSLSSGDVVTLDFTDFLASGNQTTTALTKVQPVLTVKGSNSVTKQVYRTSDLNIGTDYLQNFGTLRTDTTTRVDTKSLATSRTGYQVEVFIVAYGMTTSIETIRSKPVAWGEINYIPYNQ